MTHMLRITDGTTTINLAGGTDAISLEHYVPRAPDVSVAEAEALALSLEGVKTVEAFVEDWAAVSDGERVAAAEEPKDLKGVRPADLQYHPPRYAIHEHEGQQVVVAAYFQRGHVGMRGRQWTYVVLAYRVKDGTSVDTKGTSLPQPRWFSSR